MIGIGSPFHIATMSSGFSPTQLGTVLSWMDGNSSSNTLDTGVIYDDLHDAGTLGGTWDAATNAQPVAVATSEANAPVFRGTRRCNSSLSASSWSFLHNGTDDATITCRFYLYEVTANARLMASENIGAANIGFIALINGSSIRCSFGNGSAQTFVDSAVTLTANTWHTLQVTKNGASVAVSVDGETLVTGTIPTPSASAPAFSMVLGNVTGTTPLNGLLAECIIHDTELDASGLSQMRSYMSSKWSATPDDSVHAYGDVCVYLNADTGITTETGVSAWRDLSGYNNDAVQASTSLQPTIATWRNSRQGVTCSSTQKIVCSSFNQGNIAQPGAVYQALAWTNSSSGKSLGNGGDGVNRWVTRETSGEVAIIVSANNTSGITAPTDGTDMIRRDYFNGASSEVKIEPDGGATETSSTWSSTPGSGAWGSYCVGNENNGSNPWGDAIGTVLAYSELPSDDGAVRTILKDYYDITPSS